jgi:hypothetical protein
LRGVPRADGGVVRLRSRATADASDNHSERKKQKALDSAVFHFK